MARAIVSLAVLVGSLVMSPEVHGQIRPDSAGAGQGVPIQPPAPGGLGQGVPGQGGNLNNPAGPGQNAPEQGASGRDGSARGGSGQGRAGEAPPEAVRFQARDSLVFRFAARSKGGGTGGMMADSIGMGQAAGDAAGEAGADSVSRGDLYGFSKVEHESGTLSAGQISIWLDLDQVEARTALADDSLSYPVLKRPGEQEELKSQRILFNYETGKGKFEAARVTVSEGTLIGTKVKNVSESVVFIEEGRYSTCPPDHMYYYIQAQKLKIVDEEEIFFTNARLFLLDIPYPIPLPFGYIPASPDRRRSGLLQPTYVFQNSSRRGLGLQQVGWFQVINDYLTAQTSFDVFTSGSFFNDTRLQYRRTGMLDGSVGLGYSREQGLEPTDLNYSRSVNKRFTLQHNQQFNPYASLSTNLNLSTSNYFRRNSYDINERGSTSSTSRLAYQYRDPEGRFNFSTNASLTQQFTDNSVTLTGPSANFSVKSFSPFKRDGAGGSSGSGGGSGGSGGAGNPLENIIVTYRNDLSSRYQYRPLQSIDNPASWIEALFDPSVHRENTGSDTHFKYGFRQTAGVSMGQLIPSRFLLMSANVNLTEFWVPSTIRRSFDADSGKVVTRTVRGFASARDIQAGVSLNTTLYGLAEVNLGSIRRIRHTLRPSVGFAYKPDFSDERWGIYRSYERGEGLPPVIYSTFEGSLFGSPSAGESRSLTYSLSNVLEAKSVRRDSTGEVKEKNIRIIDNLTLSGSYNMAADSLRFSNIGLRMSSRAIGTLSLQFSANYSLYGVDAAGRPIDRFIWEDGRKIMQPLNYQFSASTSFKGGGTGPRRTLEAITPPYRPYDPFDQSYFLPYDLGFEQSDPFEFDSPWSVSLNFNYSWTWRYGQDARKRAELNAQNIRFKLSDRWTFATQVGYDFIEKELTPSQFSLNRDMICWNLSFRFNPFGQFTYYLFRLSVDSGQIQNLFQKLPILNNLERSSSPSGKGFGQGSFGGSGSFGSPGPGQGF